MTWPCTCDELCSRKPQKKTALIREYWKFSRDLISDIKSDTSGSYEKAVCSLVRSAPEIWAEALKGAMKGLGTSDELLINFLVIAKGEMAEVRRAFAAATGQCLVDWVEGECSGDYKKTLMRLVNRNSTDNIDLMPLYWAQRCKDAIGDVDTLRNVPVCLPPEALKRGTENFVSVYHMNLHEDIKDKCGQQSTFFSFSNYRKMTMESLLACPSRGTTKACAMR